MTIDTSELQNRGDLADKITNGIAKAVEFSFKKRPMLRITEDEAKRRMKIAYEAWRTLTSDAEYEPSRALIAVPTILIETIDRETRQVMPAIINTEFETKILPLNMSSKIQAERTLSALARIHGTVDPAELGLSKDK
jgi:hypothetical protein